MDLTSRIRLLTRVTVVKAKYNIVNPDKPVNPKGVASSSSGRRTGYMHSASVGVGQILPLHGRFFQ